MTFLEDAAVNPKVRAIVGYLRQQMPRTLTRGELMFNSGYTLVDYGPIGAYACFEFGLLWAKRYVRTRGFRIIEERETYRLVHESALTPKGGGNGEESSSSEGQRQGAGNEGGRAEGSGAVGDRLEQPH